MKEKPDWGVDGRDWPNRDASRFVDAGGIVWHVQVMGQGPVLLLLHGTGAATHSWRDLAPLLASHFTVLAPDLPGHGFSALPGQSLSLPFMARSVAALLGALGLVPDFVAGHSAGAAIALRMALDGVITPRALVSLNGALLPFGGSAAVVFPMLAKLLFLNPFAAPLLAWRGSDPNAVRRLIEGTGSQLDDRGLTLYGRLFRTRRHVAAAVGMMANWDLRSLSGDLPRFGAPLTLVSGARDLAVPPRDADAVQKLLPSAHAVCLPNVGHLAHEEAPADAAQLLIKAFAA